MFSKLVFLQFTSLIINKPIPPTTSATVIDCMKQSTSNITTQDDPGYETAVNKSWNVAKTVDLGIYPLAFTFPESELQIASIIKCARKFNLAVSARSGGHSYEGYSIAKNGIVIDLSNFNTIKVSPSSVTIGSGNRLGGISRSLDFYGLLIPGGSCPTVGMGGHALGGGFGFVSRKFGLVLDNIIEMTIVDGNSEIKIVNRTTNTDLFWALRGAGGGNFGIVTEFKINIIISPKITSRKLAIPIGKLKNAIRVMVERSSTMMPDEYFIRLKYFAEGKAEIHVVFAGAKSEFMSQELIQFDDMVGFNLTERWDNIVEFDSMHKFMFGNGADYDNPPFDRWKASSVMFNGEIDDISIEMFITGPFIANPLLVPGTWAMIEAYGGKVSRIPIEESTFIHRSSKLTDIQLFTSWSSPEDNFERNEMIKKWSINIEKSKTVPFSEAYQNYMDENISIARYYGNNNLEKLAIVKARHDPGNVFRFKQGIKSNAN